MHIIEKKGAEDGSCSFKYHFDETTWFFSVKASLPDFHMGHEAAGFFSHPIMSLL